MRTKKEQEQKQKIADSNHVMPIAADFYTNMSIDEIECEHCYKIISYSENTDKAPYPICDDCINKEVKRIKEVKSE